jgi:hypothetical protein
VNGTLVGNIPVAGWPVPERLTRFQITGAQLNGTLPATWPDLLNSTTMQQVYLNRDNLGGSIPDTLANSFPTSLRVFSLETNRMVGTIPPSFIDREWPSTGQVWLSGPNMDIRGACF